MRISLPTFIICAILFCTDLAHGQLINGFYPLNGVNAGSIGRPITFNLEADCLHGDPHDTLFWDFGTGANPSKVSTIGIYDGAISEKFSQTVTYFTTGDKIFTLTTVSAGNSPVTDTFGIHIDAPFASVVNTTMQSITISPNPTRGIISIQGTPSNDMYISVMSILGETVMQLKTPNTSVFTLDLSKLTAGIYYIRFSSANSVVTKKIIKN